MERVQIIEEIKIIQIKFDNTIRHNEMILHQLGFGEKIMKKRRIGCYVIIKAL
jgi:hypothetical protein